MFLINIFPFFHGNQMLSFLCCERVRSSRLEMFLKIGVLKNFAIFTGKYLCWSLFLIKLQAWTALEHLRWLLLKSTTLKNAYNQYYILLDQSDCRYFVR